jgi:hypothetical protein
MPSRKMRVELFDGEGNRYTVAFEGRITREKAVRLLDMVELLSGMSGEEDSSGINLGFSMSGSSKFDKVRAIILRHFPIVWFSSREVQLTYEQEVKEPISLSTVATYLARMAGKGMLLKAGSSRSLKYKALQAFPKAAIEQQIPR